MRLAPRGRALLRVGATPSGVFLSRSVTLIDVGIVGGDCPRKGRSPENPAER